MAEETSGNNRDIVLRMSSKDNPDVLELCLDDASLAAEFVGYLYRNKAAGSEPEVFESIIEAPCREQKPPFLSVITRTQALRIEELSDTLQCLAAQTDTDFEVILIAHNAEPERIELLKPLIEAQPEWLKDRISLVAAEGGSRARPLNVAASIARGRYFSVLDDDDLVYDNWVAVFHEHAKTHGGAILYSHVFLQIWEKSRDEEGNVRLCAKGDLVDVHCQDFDYLKQVRDNRCPCMGLAYPTALHQEFGIRFDERLTTLEDWDFLMRSYPLCGVMNTKTPTALYRLWDNASNSYNMYTIDEWLKNRAIIQQKLKNDPVVLPGSYYSKLVATTEGYDHYKEVDGSDVSLILNPAQDIASWVAMDPDSFSYNHATKVNEFVFEPAEDENPVACFRFVPARKGVITLEDFKIEILQETDDRITLSSFDINSNGFSPELGTIVFLVNSPYLEAHLEKPVTAGQVRISYRLRTGVHEGILTGTRLVIRAKEVMRGIAKRLRAKKR